jgi:hypothetical protein
LQFGHTLVNSSPVPDLPDRNPFATRATRPGALAYHFPHAASDESLIHALQKQHWWGQILGPHGSGKSTLIHALLESLEQRGRRVNHFTLHKGEKRIPIEDLDRTDWDARTQVIVDGFEQLGAWNRAALKRVCKQRHAGLLVTAHESVGFSTVFATTVDLKLAQQLVTQLQQSAEPLVHAEDVDKSFQRHNGNLREVFFELYDLYEERRLKPRSGE